MRIHSIVEPGVFEPEAIALMSEAFEAAFKKLYNTDRVSRDVAAGRILEAARFGERDPVRLRDAALAPYRRLAARPG